MTPVRLAVHGAAGRMGARVVALSRETDGVTLVGALDRAGHPRAGEDAGALAGVGPIGVPLSDAATAAVAQCDVVIDFSSAEGVDRIARTCAAAGRALVVGTTGLDDRAKAAIDAATTRCAVLVAPNMSPGVAVLARLVADAVRALGPEYDVEIVEMHHRGKADAPSGTAIRLLDAVRGARSPSEVLPVHGRSGQVGARTRDEVGVLAVRGGDVVGDHTVVIAGPGERLELVHRATSRDLFARGALRAARWLASRAPGRYTIEDSLAG